MRYAAIALLTLMALGIFAPAALAEGYTLDLGLQSTGQVQGMVKSITKVINVFAGFAGLAGVGGLVFYGVKIMFATDERAIAETKKQMMMVLIGLGIVLLSWSIIAVFAASFK